MSWLWTKSAQGGSTPSASFTQPSAPSPAAPSSSPPSSTTASAGVTDPELAKFLAFFQEDTVPKATSPPLSKTSSSSSASSSSPSVEATETPSTPVEKREDQKQPSPWFTFTFPSGPKNVSNSPVPSSTDQQSSQLSSESNSSSSPNGDDEVPATYDTSAEDPSHPSPVEATLPSTMSCIAAFDYAYHCYSIGGQFTAVYRHGTLQDCSQWWGDWRFCMRTRAMDKNARAQVIQKHYRDKERAKYEGQRSSEDVWQPRKHLVRDGVFLSHPLPDGDETDEEWAKEELSRRTEIRDKLGYGPESSTHTIPKDM